MIKEWKVLFYFEEIIFYLITIYENTAKKNKNKPAASFVLATWKVCRLNKISKLSSKKPKLKKKLIKLVL